MGVLFQIMAKSNLQHNTYRVGFLLIDGFALMSYSSAVEPLRAANLLLDDAYRFDHLCLLGDSVVSSSGALVPATAYMSALVEYDLILVVAGGDPFKVNDESLFRWLRAQARNGVRIGGVSGGPVVLSLAGIMSGFRMTLHWEHAQVLSEQAPELLIERSLYVIDRQRITCAGGTAALDMMHALITQHHGSDFARQVSDWFLHTTIRLSNAPQRSGMVERYGTHDAAVLSVIECMENHLADPLELSQLASIAGLSVRQLNRLFTDKLGVSTIAFYRQLRLNMAKDLLAQSPLSITEVSVAAGFNSSAHFSSCFKSFFGVAPSVIRSGNSALDKSAVKAQKEP